MGCWPANLTGAFFLSLIIFDLIYEKWSDLPYHAVVGVVLTGFLTFICSLIGSSITGSILLIPAVFVIIFLLSAWIFTKGLAKKGCCMNCPGDVPKEEKGKIVIVKKQDTTSSTLTGKDTCLYDNLKATPLV